MGASFFPKSDRLARGGDVLLNAREGTRPRLSTLEHVRRKPLDRSLGSATASEAAVGHHKERLTLQGFLEVAVFTTTLTANEGLSIGLRASTQNLHGVMSRRLSTIPLSSRAAY